MTNPSRVSALHVVDATRGIGACTSAFVAALARETGAPVVLVGTVDDEREARRAGLDPLAVFAPPLGALYLAVRTWRRVLRDLMASRSIEEIVCWSVVSAAATARACPEMCVVCACASGPELGIAAWLARRFESFRPTEAVALSDRAAEACRATFGVKTRRMEASVDAGMLRQDRERIRRRWSAHDDELIVGLLGDPIDVLDARRAADIVGIAAVRGARIRLLVHPTSARQARTKRWMEEVRILSFLGVEPLLARPWEVLRGLDAALVLRDGITVAGGAARGRGRDGLGHLVSVRELVMSPLPALWAARAGVPLIVEEGALDAELIRHLGAKSFASRDPLEATRALVTLAQATQTLVTRS